MQPFDPSERQEMAALEIVAADFPPEDTMSKRVVYRRPDRHPRKSGHPWPFGRRQGPLGISRQRQVFEIRVGGEFGHTARRAVDQFPVAGLAELLFAVFDPEMAGSELILIDFGAAVRRPALAILVFQERFVVDEVRLEALQLGVVARVLERKAGGPRLVV